MDFRFLSFVLALSLATPCVDGRAHGGEVQWSAPPTAYEGEPFTLQLKFENCETHERPQLSDNDVFTFRPFGGPSRQAMTRIINGRRFSRESVTYQYQVTANQHGKLKLGPITVKHDGVSELLDPITIDVSPSDREKMLYATITSDTEEAFVGQSVIATLRVWVTIPEDLIASSVETEYRIWSRLSKQSDFGVFGNRIEEMHEDRQRPGGVLMQRTLEDGSKVECLMYQIKAPVYIERLEDFELPPTRIGFAFPQTITEAEARRQLKRDMFGDPFGGNGFFGSIPRFRPSQDRILTLAPTPPEITILPLPTEGRPQSFTGAVGSFTIDTESSETTVKVGQSFPLLINLRDAADPPSLDAVERLLPPELQKQSIFDQTFQTSATPPPGVVTDGAKRFRFMIRPRSIASNQIPPVEFSFFDPKKRKYRTIKSEAIELDVEPGSAIAVNAMKSEPGNEPAKALESEETAIPLWMTPLPPGEGWLTRSDPFAWRNHVQRAALVGLPMIIWFAMTVFLQIQRWHQGHRSVRRWQRQIASASSLEEICGILAVWAKPLVLNSQVPDSQAGKRDSQRRLWDAVGVMRREGHGNLASRLESFLEDVSRIGSRVPKDLDRPKQSALQLVAERLPSPEDPTGYGSPVLRRHLTSASLMFAIVGSLGMSNSTSIPALETLRETLDRFTIPAHTDAASHTDAMKVATTDGKSVLKAYRTLLEQYPSSAELHLRLASFTGTMGDPSLQSLHELAAEKLEPYHRHSTTSFDHDLNLFDGTVGDFFDKTCVMVARWIGDLFVAAIVFGLAMLIGWFVYLIFKRRRIALTSFSGILFASLLVLALIRVDLKIRAVQQWKQPAVITQTTTPRLSDGDSFQEAMSPLEPGDKADILEKRYQWSKIRVDGKEGWVRAETLRSIPEGWL